MTKHTTLLLAGSSAARLFSSPIGPRIPCEAPDMSGLARMIEVGQTETKMLFQAAADKIASTHPARTAAEVGSSW